jgi:hypothetical protein
MELIKSFAGSRGGFSKEPLAAGGKNESFAWNLFFSVLESLVDSGRCCKLPAVII